MLEKSKKQSRWSDINEIPKSKSQIPNKFQLLKLQNKSNYLNFFIFGHWDFDACLHPGSSSRNF